MEFMMVGKRSFLNLRNSRSGQAAMEFMMTYGWVLLVIITITAGLAYFDVFNPSLFLPERCQLGYRVGCNDFLLTETTASLSVINTFADDMVISRVNITSDRMTGACDSGAIVLPLQTGEESLLTFPCAALSTVEERGNFILKTEVYYWLNSSGQAYTYPVYGEMYTRVQG